MKIQKDFILREIAGDFVLVPTGNTAMEFNGLIAINEIGSFLWKNLQSEITREQLVQKVLEEYEIDSETVKKDVDQFLSKLVNAGIVAE